MSISDLTSMTAIQEPNRILNAIADNSIITGNHDNYFASLKTGSILSDTQMLRMINVLEVEKFIPSRVAILLKLNWDDRDYASAILSNIASDLHYQKKTISRELFDFIYDKIEAQDLSGALRVIYSCMRYRPGQHVYSMDDIMQFDEQRLMSFIQEQDLIQSKVYLAEKIGGLSAQFPAHKDVLASLLKCLNLNHSEAFKEQYVKFLDAVAKAESQGVKKIIFEELAQSVRDIPSCVVFTSLHRMLKTHEFYGQHLVDVVDLTASLEAVEDHDQMRLLANKCKEAYKQSMHFLADYKNCSRGSLSLYCLQNGLVKQEWRKINKLMTDRVHLLCNCNAASESDSGCEELWPLNHKPFVKVSPERSAVEDTAESIAVMGCSWGSGHKQATSSVAEIMQSQGMHPVTIDIPDEMLADKDPGKEGVSAFSVQNVFNTLLQNKAYAVINFLRWATGMNGVYNVKEDELRKVMRRLLLVNPAVVVETVEALSEPVIKASELLGIPCLHIATDVERVCMVRDKPHEYEHFKSCIPYPEDVMFPKVSKTEKPSQIVVVGPPTKRVYDIERTPQQIRGLRKELEREIKVKIPENKKLIIISTGSNGSYSPYPEFLAEKYAGKSDEEIPFVCVVLCGSNTEYLNHVSKVSSRLPPGVIAPCKLVAPDTVEKLYRVASHGGGVVAKGGGLTVYELSKCGTRTIFDNISSKPSIHMGPSGFCLSLVNWIVKNVFRFNDVLPWEKVNQEFAINQGFGASVSTKSDFFREFDKLLASENPVKLKTNVMKFSERLPEVISQAKQAAATDPELISKRQFVLDPKSAAKVIFN